MVDDIDFVRDFGAIKKPSTRDLKQAETLVVADIMTQPVSAEQECSMLRALSVMEKHNLQDLPIVTEDGHLVGIASRVDIGIMIGRWLVPLPDEVTLPWPQALLCKERKVALLMLGTFLLWPPGAFLEPWSLALALVLALVTMFGLRVMLYVVFDLFEIEQRPLDASTAEKKEISSG